MKKFLSTLLTLTLIFTATASLAQEMPIDDATEAAMKKQFEAITSKLTPAEGKIDLGNGIGTLDTAGKYNYYDPAEAKIILEQIWGNPDGSNTLGLILPKGVDFFDTKGWAAIIEYNDVGYVSDAEADEIDYDKMMRDMKEASIEANKQRLAQGYPEANLVGWAEIPRYDKATHKLYWAKELQFTGDQISTINYDVRILGRKGILILTVISTKDNLPLIQQDLPEVTGLINFNEGNRYADFDASSDKVAEFGMSALIAGGLGAAAVKTGLFKGLLLALIAGKKFVVIGIIALFAFGRRFFGAKNKKTPQQSVDSKPDDKPKP